MWVVWDCVAGLFRVPVVFLSRVTPFRENDNTDVFLLYRIDTTTFFVYSFNIVYGGMSGDVCLIDWGGLE